MPVRRRERFVDAGESGGPRTVPVRRPRLSPPPPPPPRITTPLVRLTSDQTRPPTRNTRENIARHDPDSPTASGNARLHSSTSSASSAGQSVRRLLFAEANWNDDDDDYLDIPRARYGIEGQGYITRGDVSLDILAAVTNVVHDVTRNIPGVGQLINAGVALAQGAILDRGFGVQLTADRNASSNGATNWRVWTPEQINVAFQSTAQMASMYNSIYEQYIGQVRNPYTLFRQINGPVELRYHNVEYLRGTGSGASDCLNFESSSRSPNDTINLAGITCTPGSRGLPIQLTNSNLSAAGTWGQLQAQLQLGAQLRDPSALIPATTIHLAKRAFMGENFPDTTLGTLDRSYDGNFLINHEYSHVPLSNWLVNGIPMSSEYVARLDGNLNGGPAPQDEDLLQVGIPSNRAASGFGYPEWAADALANVAYGGYDLSDSDQSSRWDLTRELVRDLIIERGFIAD